MNITLDGTQVKLHKLPRLGELVENLDGEHRRVAEVGHPTAHPEARGIRVPWVNTIPHEKENA